MFSKFIVSAFLVVGALCVPVPDKLPQSYRPPQQPQPQQQYQAPQPAYRPQPAPPVAPPKYDFNWAVKDDYSRNDFGQTENRDGYNTKGSYYVLLPDGRRQTVTYYVNGDSGFVAEVTYEGEAQYPEPQPYKPQPQPTQPQPTFQQPRPQQTYQQPRPQQTYQQPRPQQTYQQPRPQQAYQQPRPQPSYPN